MSKRMWWLAGLGVVALCTLCGMLGLTAGINLNPRLTVRFVPNWGSLGEWVAGIFAAAAVAIALWQVVESRMERLLLRSFTHPDLDSRGNIQKALTIRAICFGGTPTTIEHFGFAIAGQPSSFIPISAFTPCYPQPKALTVGGSVELTIKPDDLQAVAWRLSEIIDGDFKKLMMAAKSMRQLHVEPLPKDAIDELEKALDRVNGCPY